MNHELYMQRCFDLARLGAGSVSPNPMVGAVLVHEGRIIGEGWHQQYGHAHAEVNALESVKPEDRHLIERAKLYVSLEPCCIQGNTPPCTDLIQHHRIPEVVISCLDQTPSVSGRGVEILRKAGVEVLTGILQAQGEALSAIRNTFVKAQRPYILLKFARTKDGFMGSPDRQVWISNGYSQSLVHKWRSEFDAFLVGTHTALTDNPELTNRLWFGKSPLRIVLDRKLRIPKHYFLMDRTCKTWVISEVDQPSEDPNLVYVNLKFDETLLPELLHRLFEHKISSLVVEGGAATLSHFIRAGWWDEARIFTGAGTLGSGIEAPLVGGFLAEERLLGNNTLTILTNLRPRPLNFA